MGIKEIMMPVYMGISGIGIGMLLNMSTGSSDVNEVRVFERDNQPKVIRVYEGNLRRDKIFLEGEEEGRYDTSLYKHLQTIEDPAERAIVEAQIYNAVDWYSE